MQSIVRFSPEVAKLDVQISDVKLYDRSLGNLDNVAFGEFAHDLTILPLPETLRPATPQELKAMTAAADTPASAIVEVFRTNSVLTHLGRLALEAEDPKTTEAYRLMGFFSAAFMLTEQITMNRTPSNWLTTVRDPSGLIAGMHTDNRDGLQLEHRLNSRRRMGAVFAESPNDPDSEDRRYLLILTPDMPTMAQSMGISTQAEYIEVMRGTDIDAKYYQGANMNPIAWEFMLRGGQPKCYWIPVESGMSWLAPTDFVFHEASTLGQNGSTSFLFLRNWHTKEEFDTWALSRV